MMGFNGLASSQVVFCAAIYCGHELSKDIGVLARSHVDVELRLTNGAGHNIKLLNDSTSGHRQNVGLCVRSGSRPLCL